MSQIFLLDTFVSHLRLSPGILKDAGKCNFIVKIHFNHFPPIEVKENNAAQKILPDCFLDFLFYKGQIRYFSMQTEELINLMKENPLKICVYRDGDSFPMCEVKIPLYGCVCNLISNDCEEFPQIFTIDGPFDLLDPGKKFSGRIYINVALANYGRFADSHHLLQKKSFIFKNSLHGSEFECFRVSVPEYSSMNIKIDPRTLKKISDIDWSCCFQEDIDNCIKDLVVILPSSKYLSIEKPSMKTAPLSLKEAELPQGKMKKAPKKAKKGKK